MDTPSFFFFICFCRASSRRLLLIVQYLQPPLSSLSIPHFQASVRSNMLCFFRLFLLRSTSFLLFLIYFLPSEFKVRCPHRVPLFPVGEPSWSPGNGNHTQDSWGHFWTHICHGWEPRIPHKGWCAFQVCSCTLYRDGQYTLTFAYKHWNSQWNCSLSLWCNPHMDGLEWNQPSINKSWYINHGNPTIFVVPASFYTTVSIIGDNSLPGL